MVCEIYQRSNDPSCYMYINAVGTSLHYDIGLVASKMAFIDWLKYKLPACSICESLHFGNAFPNNQILYLRNWYSIRSVSYFSLVVTNAVVYLASQIELIT